MAILDNQDLFIMKLTLSQKRFLIVWICLHSFALFVNVAKIKGTIQESSSFFTLNGHYEYVFTDGENNDNFWPFTKFYEKVYKSETEKVTATTDIYFHGIFNSYGLVEYISYIIFGLALIYIPKFWSKG
jgi:hypothetical protein